MIDFQNMSVEVHEVAPNAVEAACPGESQWEAMFKAYDVDLTAPGDSKVTFPFWYKQPVVAKTQGEPERCIFWGQISMTRDTAVWLVKQAFWALMSETIPAEHWSPPDTGDPAKFDCETSKWMLQIARQLYGVQNVEDLAGWPIDAGVFAYLMSYSPTVQQLAKAAAADYPEMKLGEPWTEGNALLSQGGAVVPPMVEEYGGTFVPLGVPAACIGNGVAPGGAVPGGPPAVPGTEGVGAGEQKGKLPSWALPAGLFLGGAIVVGGVIYAGVKAQEDAPSYGYNL